MKFKAKNFIYCFIPTSICFIGFIVLHFIFIKYLIMKILSILLTLICSISGLITLVLNPGIIYNQKNEGINNENKIYCFECRFQYPHLDQKLTHCENCGVCVYGRDHHCDVFGKCVGKNNLSVFSTFSISVCILLIFNFVSMGIILVSEK